MTDPKRLLSGTAVGEEAELEQRLFSSIREVSAPASAKARGWEAIAGELGVAAGAAVATGVAVAGATGAVPSVVPPAAPLATGFLHTLAGKVIVGLAISGTAAAGGAWVVRRASRPAPAPVTAPVPVQAASPPAVSADPAASAEGKARAHGVARPPPKDGLRVEGGLLTEARARLRAGNPRGALALLEQLDQRFPRGALLQEREVLAIQALEASGDTDGAARRARAFLKAYPGSPHAPLLRHLASP